MDETQRRKAANEAIFREVNERIETLQHRFALAEDGWLNIVCECDRIDCAERLSVPVDSYEGVRSDSACFFVANGHEDPAVEDVLDSAGDAVIVRKHQGEPQEIAERTDPRD